MPSAIWTYQYDTLENNLGVNHKSTTYLKVIYYIPSDQHFSLKYFLKIAFVRDAVSKYEGSQGRYKHEWVKILFKVV